MAEKEFLLRDGEGKKKYVNVKTAAYIKFVLNPWALGAYSLKLLAPLKRLSSRYFDYRRFSRRNKTLQVERILRNSSSVNEF